MSPAPFRRLGRSLGVDLAVGLGLHLTEALKMLAALKARGLVKRAAADGRGFYVPGGEA